MKWPSQIIGALVLIASPAVAAAQSVTTSKTVEADGTTTMVHQVTVNAPVAEVWTAISTPEGWMTWAVPLARWTAEDASVLETSYNVSSQRGGPDTIHTRFVAIIPGRLLVFRTIKAPEGFPHWDVYQGVTSVFELEADGSKTRVKLTSTGYPDNEAGKALVSFFERGNAMTLEMLGKRFP